MIGNETDARFIRDWVTEHNSRSQSYYGTVPAPEGWTRLSQGCYRAAWKHDASGVVYKVQHDYVSSFQSNAGEANTLRRYYLKKMPDGCRLPRFQYFELDGRGVIAMEYFSRLLKTVGVYRDPKGYHDSASRLRDALEDVYDLHNSNLAVDEENGLVVPIDLGG